jgi:hypothetical protein
VVKIYRCHVLLLKQLKLAKGLGKITGGFFALQTIEEVINHGSGTCVLACFNLFGYTNVPTHLEIFRVFLL